MSDVLNSLLNASFVIGGSPILWREIIGNCLGLASAVLYLVYAAFVLWGFVVWNGVQRSNDQEARLRQLSSSE